MLALLQQDWEAAGHASPGAWLALAGRALSALLAAAYLGLVLRAFVRQRRYRARGVLSDDDLRTVHDSLAAVERRTVGEILPVVVERSDRHADALLLAALACALVGSTGLAFWIPWERPALLVLAQLALGAAGYTAAWFLPDLQRAFVGERRAREVAEEQAFQEFHRYDLHRTEARTGILLFVSLLEHRAIVLADEGVDARVGPERWARTNELVLAGIRRGSLRDGLRDGIEEAGAVLAEHFPVTEGDRNEVPDRVIVRRE